MITRFAFHIPRLALALAASHLMFAAAGAAPVRKPALRAAPAKAPVEAAPAPVPDVATVALVTDQGTIVVELDGKHAPVSVGNFLHYVDSKRYDGMMFYRAMHLEWGQQPNGLLQGGIRDGAKLFKPVAHEPTSQTGILHKAGTLSLARLAPGTATSDFSILLSDIPSLDADPASADPAKAVTDTQLGYAAFGHVVSGMDVVRKIWDMPISPTLGEGAMRGQMLAQPVKVITARRVPNQAPQPATVPASAPVPATP
ncbi:MULTISPECIES: peptidylprolyl isomerase [unclassified Sphingomonas]|uniref:peptidylprolyl isomerase n=1 Tax=Novosphingobium rhizosphaerae TaxID=1551649 RepID=UPI0015CC9964